MIRVAAETLPEELLALIAKVEAGDVILLERDGVVIARIEPPPAAVLVTNDSSENGAEDQPEDAASHAGTLTESLLARELRELRKGVTLGGLDWKALRDEGRR